MPRNDLIFDNWTKLSFKRALGNRRAAGRSFVAPQWVGTFNERRLQAYKVLQAYIDNAARYFVADTEPDEEEESQRREYGEAELLVSQIVGAVVGDEQSISVEDADAFDATLLPPEPGAADDVLEAWEENLRAERAVERQELLTEWADNERLWLKMIEAETDAVGLGDGVYVLGWSEKKQRPRLKVYDPGFYFPVLSDNSEEDYPTIVHLAWEIEPSQYDPAAVSNPSRVLVRRITYRLGTIGPRTRTGPDGNIELVLDELTGEPILYDGDEVDDEGQITRLYPWESEPSSVTCYMTDAVWEINLEKHTVEDFTEARAVYNVNEDGDEVRNLDLGIDFIPVIHVPNTPATKEHYGESSLAVILQILDDIASTDTDLQAASSTTGGPVIALSGAKLARQVDRFGRPVAMTYGPSQVFELGENGKMDVMDTSGALDALLKYIEQLLKRLSVNVRVPEEALGRVRASDVPSGIALLLSWGPFRAMVRKMRLVRHEKYPLLLKFVERFFMLAGIIESGATMRAEVRFGSFLPSDKGEAVKNVTQLLQAKAISRSTALGMLIEAGFPIDDAAEELRRIEQEDFESAQALLDLTGNDEAVADRVGVDITKEEEPLEPDVPRETIEGEPDEEELFT